MSFLRGIQVNPNINGYLLNTNTIMLAYNNTLTQAPILPNPFCFDADTNYSLNNANIDYENPFNFGSLNNLRFEKDYAKEFRQKNEKIAYNNIVYTKYGSNSDKIKGLSNDMQVKTAMLLDFAKSKGLDVKIISGFRSQAQQNDLVRRKPNLAAKNSLHCLGRAIDINITNGKDSDYRMLANYAKSIGMRWGGDFKQVAERWHFDIGRA